jgi:hypothetical protein
LRLTPSIGIHPICPQGGDLVFPAMGNLEMFSHPPPREVLVAVANG